MNPIRLKFFLKILTGICLALALPAVAQAVPVTFHWSPPVDGAPVDQYEVFVSRDGGALTFVGAESDTTYELEVEYGVGYFVCVRGVSEDGRHGVMSEPSEEFYLERPYSGNAVPDIPLLRPNFPNPFNPETTIRYGVSVEADGAPAALEIYNVRGVRVRSFAPETSPGWHSVVWDGRDESGVVLPSGGYIVRYATVGQVRTWKMSMVK